MICLTQRIYSFEEIVVDLNTGAANGGRWRSIFDINDYESAQLTAFWNDELIDFSSCMQSTTTPTHNDQFKAQIPAKALLDYLCFNDFKSFDAHEHRIILIFIPRKILHGRKQNWTCDRKNDINAQSAYFASLCTRCRQPYSRIYFFCIRSINLNWLAHTAQGYIGNLRRITG